MRAGLVLTRRPSKIKIKETRDRGILGACRLSSVFKVTFGGQGLRPKGAPLKEASSELNPKMFHGEIKSTFLGKRGHPLSLGDCLVRREEAGVGRGQPKQEAEDGQGPALCSRMLFRANLLGKEFLSFTLLPHPPSTPAPHLGHFRISAGGRSF